MILLAKLLWNWQVFFPNEECKLNCVMLQQRKLTQFKLHYSLPHSQIRSHLLQDSLLATIYHLQFYLHLKHTISLHSYLRSKE